MSHAALVSLLCPVSQPVSGDITLNFMLIFSIAGQRGRYRGGSKALL